MTPAEKRKRARCVREAALGFEEATARTMRELAEELEAEAQAEESATGHAPVSPFGARH